VNSGEGDFDLGAVVPVDLAFGESEPAPSGGVASFAVAAALTIASLVLFASTSGAAHALGWIVAGPTVASLVALGRRQCTRAIAVTGTEKPVIVRLGPVILVAGVGSACVHAGYLAWILS